LETNLQRLRELWVKNVAAQRDLESFWLLSPDLLAVLGSDLHYIRVNPTWESVLGWKNADCVGKHYSYFVHPDDLARTEEYVERARDPKVETPADFSNRVRDAKGAYKLINWRVTVSDTGEMYSVGREMKDASLQSIVIVKSE
jgi:PAS domain S-box-containing protein